MLQHYVTLLIGLSIPHSLVRIWLTFAIWGLKPTLHARKLILFAVASSVVIDLDYPFVPPVVHAVTSTVVVIIFLFLVFRRLGRGPLLIVFLTYAVVSLCADMIGTGALRLLYGWIDRKEMLEEHVLAFHSVYAPLGVALAWLAYRAEKKNFAFFPRLYQVLLDFKQTRAKEALLLTLLQVFLLGLLFALGLSDKPPYEKAYFAWIVSGLVLLACGAVFYSIRIMILVREDAISETREDYVGEIGKMFTAIRGQRHDFLNHLQVMSSMLQMSKLEQLKRYMNDLAAEAHSFGSVVAHSSPAVAAFLSAKCETAQEKGISFTYDVPAKLDVDSVIKPIDLVKIVGNLVDNAFEESETLPPGSRLVHVAIRGDPEKLSLEVSNRGRALSEDEIKRILLPGYTTKKSGHSGLGLAIVQERVQFYKGNLSIDAGSGEGVSFRVTLPRGSRIKSAY